MYSHGVLSHYSLLSPLAITSLLFTGCRDRLHLHVAQQDYENGCNYRLKQQILQVQMIQVHWLYSDTPVVSWETRSSLINYLQVEYCEYSALVLTCRAVHWHISMKTYLWLLFVVVPLRQYSEEAHGLIHYIVKKPLCLSISYRYTAWLMIAYDLQPIGQFKIDLIYPLILGS